MKTCTRLLLLFSLMSSTCSSSAPGFSSVLSELHQSVTLPCTVPCSGSVEWLRVQKPSPDVVVTSCNQTSCSSEEGFILAHHHFLKGNRSLTITAATYRKRGWYTCVCDAEEVCAVSLHIKPVELQTQSSPGGSFVMELEVSEGVEVLLARSPGDGAQSSVLVPCVKDYERRVELKSWLMLRSVQAADSGVYILRDADNNETISTHTLTVAGNHTDTNNTLPAKGELGSWNLWRIFTEEFRGVVVGLVLGALLGGVVLWLVNFCCRARINVRRWWRGDGDDGMPRSLPEERFMLKSPLSA